MHVANNAEEISKDTTEINLLKQRISPETAKVIAKSMGKCENLTHLILKWNQCGDEGGQAIGRAIAECKNLTHLDLSHNKFGEEGGQAIGKGIAECKNLTHLDLSHNKFGEEGGKAIGKGIAECKNLTHLDLCRNKFGDEGKKAIANAIAECKNLAYLDLGWNQCGKEGGKAIANAIAECKNLTNLNLSCNQFGEEGGKAIAKAIVECKNLTHLDVSRNQFGDEGGKAIANAIAECKNLIHLDLNWNQCGDEGGQAIGKGIAECKNLTNLNLSRNEFGKESGKAIGKGIAECKNLIHLDLNWSQYGDEGGKAIGKGIAECKNLTYLDLCHNQIGEEGGQAIGKGIAECKNLDYLNLSSNKIGEEGGKAIGKGIAECKNLDYLNLSSNKIGEEGGKAIGKGIAECKNLIDLDLSFNEIGEEGGKAIEKGIAECKNLTYIYLDCNKFGGAKAVAKSLHKTCPFVQIDFDDLGGLTPENLFAKVRLPGEDMNALDTNSCVSINVISENSTERSNEQDSVNCVNDKNIVVADHGVDFVAIAQDLDGSPTQSESVSFADVVQLAKTISDLRANRGGARGNSLQTGIALLEEFKGPAIQGYFGQMKLRIASSGIQNSKQRIDALQDQIRGSSSDGLPDLIKERNAERSNLQSLVQDVRANNLEFDGDTVEKFKSKLARFLEYLDINVTPVIEEEPRADDIRYCEALALRVNQCIDEYNLNPDTWPNNIGQRRQEAAERIVYRMNELQLGDTFSLALGAPEKAVKLEPELLELKNALREEFEVLQKDTFSGQVSEILRTMSSAFNRFERYSENIMLNAVLVSKDIQELDEYLRLGSNMPNVQSLRDLYDKLTRSSNAMGSLKRAKEELESEGLEENERKHYRGRVKKMESILSQGTPIELSKAFRHKLAETLHLAKEHYPELLQDQDWLESIHVSAAGVLEVACADLWLPNIKIMDFKSVGEPLASRGGKKVQRVLDNDGRTLVLKQFQLGHASNSKAFYKQVAKMGNVVSQNVIRITGAFVDTMHGMPWGCIVMPYYELGDLAKWIQEHPNEGKASRDRLAMGLLYGMADLHLHGIVHCDIKPENIFLTSNGTPLLGDFDGIKIANCTATYTSFQATPRYIAPELRDGRVSKFETAMDMYSVGVVLEDLYPVPNSSIQKLIKTLKAQNPAQRLSAREALCHEAFGAAVDPEEKCHVCMEEILASEGTSCEKGHFLCRYCIAKSVEVATQPQTSVLVGGDGTMKCMEHECAGRITGQAIIRLAPKALNHLLVIAKRKAESEAAIRTEQEIQRRVADLVQMDEQSRDVQRHLQHIQEKIFNVFCPSCGSCFDQFDGCCALECANRECGRHFCAWCLSYSSQDSEACHEHVRTCSKRRGEDPFYPDSFKQVEEVWKELRADRLVKYWNENVRDRSLSNVLREQLEPLLKSGVVGTRFRLSRLN